MKDTDFIKHDLTRNDWIGIVINNTDTTFSGRAKVRVFGVMDGIPNEHLPWASPINSGIFSELGSGNVSVPKLGTFVRIQFNNGDIYAPEMLAIQNIDQSLIDEIKEDYDGTHVLLFDTVEDLKIIYQRSAGLLVYLKESFFQISSDSMITLQHADTDSIIQMESDIIRVVTKNEVEVTAAAKVTVSADEVIVAGNNTTKVGPGPYNHAMLAEPMWALLSSMATALDAKLPLTPGANVLLVESTKSAATSTNVLISK